MTETQRILENALAQHRGGNVAEAERLYRQVLAAEPDNADALHLLGLIAHHAGQHGAARDLIGRAIALRPSAAEFHNNLGEAYRGLGDLSAALTCYSHAVELDPRLAEAHHNLGVASADRGDVAQAMVHYRRAIEARPGFALALNNLGNLLGGQGQQAEAIAILQEAVASNPDFAEAHNNLGSVLKDLGRLEEARAHYLKALEARPDFAMAISNLGSVCYEQGRLEEAISYFRRALAAPAPPAGVWVNLGKALNEQGRWREAEATYRRAHDAEPSGAAEMRLACVVPVIAESAGELAESRGRVLERVAALEQRELAIRDPLSEVNSINFYLAYQGGDDRALQERIGRIYERACPSLSFTAAHCGSRQRRAGEGRIKLGFVSRLIGQQSVARALMSGVLQELSRKRYSVHVFSFAHARNAEYATIAAAADQVTILPPVLEASRVALAAAELDVLCYIDIGMDPITYFLAFSRLAPVQCATWMHPVTTGIRNVDYFLSSALFEPESAEAHYSERLIRFNHLPTFYKPPARSEPVLARPQLGLAEDANAYLCPQSLFKIHPDFDTVLAGVLRADPAGVIYLIEGNHRNWTEILMRRFRSSIGDVCDRIRFLPRMPTRDFPHLLAAADVILDPLHWSGGITSLDALADGTPIVTLPGKLMRGRVTHGIYRAMDVSDCIASSAQDYVAIAARLGRNGKFRRSVREKILAKNGVLYENTGCVHEYEEFFESATGP